MRLPLLLSSSLFLSLLTICLLSLPAPVCTDHIFRCSHLRRIRYQCRESILARAPISPMRIEGIQRIRRSDLSRSTQHSEYLALNAGKNGANVMPAKLALDPKNRSKKGLSADRGVGTNDHFSSKRALYCQICQRYINASFASIDRSREPKSPFRFQ